MTMHFKTFRSDSAKVGLLAWSANDVSTLIGDGHTGGEDDDDDDDDDNHDNNGDK